MQIDRHGLWLHARGSEYFLPFDGYPWFADAKIADVLNVELLHGSHLHWPALDVDLHIESIADPQAYPLIDRG